jgi:hypothetical protein
MTTVAPTTTAGSMLGAVNRQHADDYQRSLTTLGHRLPLGWDAAGWRGRLAGYDLLLATPRTLSALGWFLMGGGQPELGRQVHQAHREAARAVAVEFAADRERVARQAQQLREGWLERHLDAIARDRELARVLAWRGRVEVRAVELERPGWLRELGEVPATVKGQRALRQVVARVEQYRERYGITDPERALGPEPRGGDLEQRRHHRVAFQAIERLQARRRTERQQRLDQRERAHADQPRTAPADRARPPRVDERERGAREREAG